MAASSRTVAPRAAEGAVALEHMQAAPADVPVQRGLAQISPAAIGNKMATEPLSWYPTNREDTAMDKDRIKGSAEQAKGSVKEAAGKMFGDKKLETDGKTDKTAGKVQNAIGGLKDAARGK